MNYHDLLESPDGDQLKGELAGLLGAARDSKRSPNTVDLLVRIKLVAGPHPSGFGVAWAAA